VRTYVGNILWVLPKSSQQKWASRPYYFTDLSIFLVACLEERTPLFYVIQTPKNNTFPLWKAPQLHRTPHCMMSPGSAVNPDGLFKEEVNGCDEIGRSLHRFQTTQSFNVFQQEKRSLMEDTSSARPSKKIRRRRVVCKARGLSKKHNSDTAFFEIHANAPHGLLLTCSHPECVASGRRFRYCQGTW
jgi:hypothetical protein